MVGCERWAVPNASFYKKICHRGELFDQVCLFCFFRFQGQVLFCIEPDIFQHHHFAGLHGADGIPCVAPEYAVDIHDRFTQEQLELLGVCFKGCEVFFPGAALVGNNDRAAPGEGMNCRKVLRNRLSSRMRLVVGSIGELRSRRRRTVFPSHPSSLMVPIGIQTTFYVMIRSLP